MSAIVRSKKTSSGVAVLYLVIGTILCVVLMSVLGSGHAIPTAAPTPTEVLDLGTIFKVTSYVKEGKYIYKGQNNLPLDAGVLVELTGRTGLLANGREILEVAMVEDESYVTYVTIDDLEEVSKADISQ